MNWENATFENESTKQLNQIGQLYRELNRAFDGMFNPYSADDGDCQRAADLINELMEESAELFDLISANCNSAPTPGAFLSKVIFNHRQVG